MSAAFAIAGCDVRVLDSWPREAIRITAMQAYMRLAAQQQIVMRYPVQVFSDRLEIRYLSQLPAEWTRALLHEAEKAILTETRASLRAEIDGLAAEIHRMVDSGMTDKDLAAFEVTAGRYNDCMLKYMEV